MNAHTIYTDANDTIVATNANTGVWLLVMDNDHKTTTEVFLTDSDATALETALRESREAREA